MASFPPGPKRRYPGSLLLAFRRNPLQFLTDGAREFGDAFHIAIAGDRHFFSLYDADLIEEVLVTKQKHFVKSDALARAKRVLGEGLLTSEGELHRRERRLLQPGFHRDMLARYGEVMIRHGLEYRDRWVDGAAIDLDREMGNLAMGIAAESLFHADVAASAKQLGDALTDILNVFPIVPLPFEDLLEKLPTPGMIAYRKAQVVLDRAIYAMIDQRRGNPGPDDLLGVLLRAADTENDGAGLPDTQIRDEVMTLFLAGHETTAHAMTWAWYLLGENPEAAKAFYEEIDGVLGSNAPVPADMERLPYTRTVLAEAMRLYPPAWIVARKAVDDCTIGPYDIPKNSAVIMSQYVVHRLERYFPEPERFHPERWVAIWAEEEATHRQKFSYFPFGGGARRCIGEGFAWLEGILLLALFGQRWRMQHKANHVVALKPTITLRPKNGMMMQVHARRQGA